jgi:N6-adenosine-specific RNA methylase IME4
MGGHWVWRLPQVSNFVSAKGNTKGTEERGTKSVLPSPSSEHSSASDISFTDVVTEEL